MNNKVVFTCNVGGYDNSPIPPSWAGWDKVLFTDNIINQHKGWTKVIEIEKTDRPDLIAKKYKWLIHQYLPDYDLFLWFDSNMKLIGIPPPPKPFRIIHHKRNSVTQEAKALNDQQHRWKIESVNEQVSYFKEDGFPDNQGLFLNGFFCRENSLIENEISEYIYNIMTQFTSRDMLALPYVLWKLNYKYDKSVLKSIVFFNKFVRMSNHNIKKPPIYGSAN